MGTCTLYKCTIVHIDDIFFSFDNNQKNIIHLKCISLEFYKFNTVDDGHFGLFFLFKLKNLFINPVLSGSFSYWKFNCLQLFILWLRLSFLFPFFWSVQNRKKDPSLESLVIMFMEKNIWNFYFDWFWIQVPDHQTGRNSFKCERTLLISKILEVEKWNWTGLHSKTEQDKPRTGLVFQEFVYNMKAVSPSTVRISDSLSFKCDLLILKVLYELDTYNPIYTNIKLVVNKIQFFVYATLLPF